MDKNKLIEEFTKKYQVSSPYLNLKLSQLNQLECGSIVYIMDHMIKDYEFYIQKGEDPDYVLNEFYDSYKELVTEYIKVFCNDYTKDIYEQNFSSEQIKYVTDKLLNSNDILKMNLEDITKKLIDGFNSLVKKENKKETPTIIDFKKYKKTGVIEQINDFETLQMRAIDAIKEIQNEYYNHPMYSDNSSTVMKMIYDTVEKVDKLFDIYEQKPSLDLKNKIMYDIRTLDASVRGLLENAYKVKLAKDDCNDYVDFLVKKDYLSEDRGQEFKDRIDKCITAGAVKKYKDVLFNNYFYPPTIRKIKQGYEKKNTFWKNKDKENSPYFDEMKTKIFADLDNHIFDEEGLKFIENMGIEGAYKYIEKNNFKTFKSR